MRVHWAKEGTVVHRLHNLTRHRIFAGPGMQIAQDVGETAHGGQVRSSCSKRGLRLVTKALCRGKHNCLYTVYAVGSIYMGLMQHVLLVYCMM